MTGPAAELVELLGRRDDVAREAGCVGLGLWLADEPGGAAVVHLGRPVVLHDDPPDVVALKLLAVEKLAVVGHRHNLVLAVGPP